MQFQGEVLQVTEVKVVQRIAHNDEVWQNTMGSATQTE